MIDWSRLSHAYGSAEDIPPLLDRIAANPNDRLWNQLWSALCDQGTVYSASFAVLPWLTTITAGADRTERLNALFLAGTIMAGADQPHGAGDVREAYAAQTADLLRMAEETLPTLTARDEYIYLLQSVLALEGVPIWGEELDGLVHEEYEVDCPDCDASLFIVIGRRGLFATSDDYVLKADIKKSPLRPADPADLHGLGQRLHATALSHGQDDLATSLTYLFGQARCPDCHIDFPVAERVGAYW
jgi:hypothetical protein